MPTRTTAPASSPIRQEGPRLPFAEHLEELRRRLAVSLLALLLAVGLSFTQVERIVGWLQRPAAGRLPRFAFMSLTEPLLAYLNVAMLAGCVLAMPMLLAQAWGFVRSGLTPKERAYGLVFIWWGSLHFLLGAAFGYFFLLPVSLRVLLGIGASYLEPVISIQRYLSFVTSLVFWCGVIFELPVLLVVLTKVGIVTPTWLRQQRPYAMLVLVIIAAVVTPTTDPVNLLLMAVPLILLYELSILLAQFVVPTTRSSRFVTSPPETAE